MQGQVDQTLLYLALGADFVNHLVKCFGFARFR